LNGLRNFYPEEYDLLVYLANGQQDKFNAVIETCPEYLTHLVGYGILVRRGNEHEFLFDAIREVLNAYTTGAQTDEDRWAEISARRNKAEQGIRTALYHWAARLSEEDWDAACDMCVPKQIERVGRIGRRHFFSKSQSPLYLLDLRSFVEFADWTTDAREMHALNGAFDTVNKLRKDAHAKSITDEEYRDWSISMQLLEDTFLPPA
jgi:hypothetical protein